MISESFLRNYSQKNVIQAAIRQREKLKVFYARHINKIFKDTQKQVSKERLKEKFNRTAKDSPQIFYRYTVNSRSKQHSDKENSTEIINDHHQFFRGKPKTPLKRREIRFTTKQSSEKLWPKRERYSVKQRSLNKQETISSFYYRQPSSPQSPSQTNKDKPMMNDIQSQSQYSYHLLSYKRLMRNSHKKVGKKTTAKQKIIPSEMNKEFNSFIRSEQNPQNQAENQSTFLGLRNQITIKTIKINNSCDEKTKLLNPKGLTQIKSIDRKSRKPHQHQLQVDGLQFGNKSSTAADKKKRTIIDLDTIKKERFEENAQRRLKTIK